MDMTESIAPKTDQINAADLTKGPINVTITRVTTGPPEQPFSFHMTETPGRAYRPSKSMRRVMIAAWGKDPSAFVGHSLTLYCNPATRYGNEVVGGIEISHLSHIERAVTVVLTVTRGKRKSFTVQPLTAPAPRDWVAEATAATTSDEILAVYKKAKQAGADADTVLDPIVTLGTDRRAAEAALTTAGEVDA